MSTAPTVNIATKLFQRPLVLLAPRADAASPVFRNVQEDVLRHGRLLAAMQRLRGRVYLADGAIQPGDLEKDQRHVDSADEHSWHILMLDPKDDNKVLGCARWLQHRGLPGFNTLQIRRAPLASCANWGARFRGAVEEELDQAYRMAVSYVEIGGWALDEAVRGTTEALRSAIATFAWTRLIGGARAIGTVTQRNGSASILKRMGGRPLEFSGIEIPPYFDSEYNCNMEILRFDSRRANPRYEDLIRSMEGEMAGACVIAAGGEASRPGLSMTADSVFATAA